jgi:hypothetical protein
MFKEELKKKTNISKLNVSLHDQHKILERKRKKKKKVN